MNKLDLRLEYKFTTGKYPFLTDGNYLLEEARDHYFRWLEDELLEARKKLEKHEE